MWKDLFAAHLYQRILDREEHVAKLDYVATLSAYSHWKLTGKKVIGIGDAANGIAAMFIFFVTFASTKEVVPPAVNQKHNGYLLFQI